MNMYFLSAKDRALHLLKVQIKTQSLVYCCSKIYHKMQHELNPPGTWQDFFTILQPQIRSWTVTNRYSTGFEAVKMWKVRLGRRQRYLLSSILFSLYFYFVLGSKVIMEWRYTLGLYEWSHDLCIITKNNIKLTPIELFSGQDGKSWGSW